MFMRAIAVGMLVAALWATGAWASSFDGLTVDQIRAHPDFVADTQSMDSAKNSGDVDAKHIYWWIGYIPEGDKRIYFTSFGEPLTCVKWDKTGEWVPEWVADALNKLVDKGLIKLS
jgi:hypothetical protein